MKEKRKETAKRFLLFPSVRPLVLGGIISSSPIVGMVVTISLLSRLEIGERYVGREKGRVSVDLKSIKKSAIDREIKEQSFFVPSFFFLLLPLSLPYPSLSL